MFIVGGLAELRTKLVDETCEQAVYDAVDRCWKANLQICNCLTKLLIKDQIKSEIMHLRLSMMGLIVLWIINV